MKERNFIPTKKETQKSTTLPQLTDYIGKTVDIYIAANFPGNHIREALIVNITPEGFLILRDKAGPIIRILTPPFQIIVHGHDNE